MKLQQDLREFVESFLSRGVEFVVVGGHAVAFHGYPRMTDDIDILVRPSRENGERIIGALEAFGFGDMGLTADSFTASDRVIQLGRAPNRVDLTQICGVSLDEVWSTRVTIPAQHRFMATPTSLPRKLRCRSRSHEYSADRRADVLHSEGSLRDLSPAGSRGLGGGVEACQPRESEASAGTPHRVRLA